MLQFLHAALHPYFGSISRIVLIFNRLLFSLINRKCFFFCYCTLFPAKVYKFSIRYYILFLLCFILVLYLSLFIMLWLFVSTHKLSITILKIVNICALYKCLIINTLLFYIFPLREKHRFSTTIGPFVVEEGPFPLRQMHECFLSFTLSLFP